MVSKDGEEVLFGVPFLFNANGRVETWLTTLLTVTKDAVTIEAYSRNMCIA